jgi:copper(I)-binding protein
MTPSPRPTFVALALGACLLVGAAACGSGDGDGRASASAQVPATGEITIAEATIDRPLNPSTAAVRMVIRNGTGTADALESVRSSVSERATIHRSGTDAEGRSVMRAEDGLEIAARSTVTFEPGGLHVMLTGITRPLEVGDEVELTLEFEQAGPVTATAEVVELGASGDDAGAPHDDH